MMKGINALTEELEGNDQRKARQLSRKNSKKLEKGHSKLSGTNVVKDSIDDANLIHQAPRNFLPAK